MLKPNVRQVGQQVLTAHQIHKGDFTIPAKTHTSISGIVIGPDKKVHYKIAYQSRYAWVLAADLKSV